MRICLLRTMLFHLLLIVIESLGAGWFQIKQAAKAFKCLIAIPSDFYIYIDKQIGQSGLSLRLSNCFFYLGCCHILFLISA